MSDTHSKQVLFSFVIPTDFFSYLLNKVAHLDGAYETSRLPTLAQSKVQIKDNSEES